MGTYAERTCFQVKQGRRYQKISYQKFQTLTFRLTSFLRRQNISRVAIIADNCLEWIVAYAACLLSGGVVVPLRTTLAPATLRAILQDSGVDLVILPDAQHARDILSDSTLDTSHPMPEFRTILTINDEAEHPPGVTRISGILGEATSLPPEEQETIRSYAESVAPHAMASIFYLPSKTGEPKGAVFDHAQSLATARHIAEWFTFDEDDLAFTIRPWSELPNLATTLHYFLSGIPNVLSDNLQTVEASLHQASPTVMLATPHFFERAYDRIMDEVAQMPESTQQVFRWAVAKGKEHQAAGSAASPELRQEHARADMTFFSQMRGSVGGRLRRIYSTSASLSQEVVEFFEAIGLPALNVYSLTEAGGFPAVSTHESHRPGSCGRVAPGFEIRIADDGEVLVRGETVLREYWRRPDETRQAIDADGWLHSGDLGYLDEDGFLYITGRKQHLMVLSTGFKIAPSVIESALEASPFIAQAGVFGEGRPYVSALIFPDMEWVRARLQVSEGDNGEEAISASDPRVEALVHKAIGEVNARLDRWEQIEQYRLLDQALSAAIEEPTPFAMETHRHLIAERYAAQIAAMYPTSIQLKEKEVSEVQIDPERLRELLEKESILDAWLSDAGIGFLFELAREKQIDAPSMVHICDTAATIAQMESEEKPLSTALIVGDPVRIGHVLTPSQIQLLHTDHIRRMRKVLVTMAKMVDGLVLGYVVDKYGYVRGVYRLEVPLDEPNSLLLGPQFRQHAAISRLCEAMVFFVPSGGRQVRVFANGQLVGRYANGDWSPDNLYLVDEVVAQLAEQKKYDLGLIQRVLHCAFQMSEENLGAIFLLGDADLILRRSDASEISSFAAFVSADVAQLSDRELINFAKQDGATMIDVQGQFRGCMVLLRPGATTRAEIGPGKGARHSSAAKMSAEAECLAITVSQDGPVTVYDCGRQVLSL